MNEILSPAARAERRQREASDPAVSAFVSASAGSGKTKLLIDRLLRLMLAGAAPSRIQCLTYTTAAAAEMALRLRRVLGGWVTADDATLDAALVGLDLTPTPALRDQARSLFAAVVDLPGGMRIETIHAFCQSLLRRFPLEAALSPHFRLLGEDDSRVALDGAEEAVLAEAGEGDPTDSRRAEALARLAAALDVVAVAVGRDAFGKVARDFVDARDRLGPLLARGADEVARLQRLVLGSDRSVLDIRRAAVQWPGEAALREALLATAAEKAGSRPQLRAQPALAWLSRDPAARAARWDELEGFFLTAKGEPCAASTMVAAGLARRSPRVQETLLAEQARVLALREAQCAAHAAALSAAVTGLLLPAAHRFAAAKASRARLDYADLIEAATTLLRDPGTAWVLHKLDDGLDHLLLDEVQDTAPAQWAIAHALVGDFFAGEGARPGPRTVFAVGDKKQSIFSFQGAEPAQFEQWRDRLRREAAAANRPFRDGVLDVSFRSTAPVLALVDRVFADPLAARGVVAEGETLRHVCARGGQAGAVEIFPLVAWEKKDEPPEWAPPERHNRVASAPQRLVEQVADWIAQAVSGPDGGGVALPSRGRAARPGDILVLLRRRENLAGPLVRRLKQRGVAVAGLDRMALTTEPAVADLLALCDTLLLPQDDLSLATVLTSPLGGLDDDDLIALAPGRAGTLWDTLRVRAAERPAWQAAWAFLRTLFGRVDFATPHLLLVEALGALGGRARLLARLGPEAAEPIDELLAEALAYAEEHPPSLQGFVQWLRRSAASIKREASEAGDAVRVMTVHGAKGLEAPIVVLPDTTTPPRAREGHSLLWAEVEGVSVPIWAPGERAASAVVRALRETARQRQAEEHNRLLYVALTRAEDVLVVFGHGMGRALAEDSWYRLIERGILGLGEAARCAQTAAPDRLRTTRQGGDRAALPAWVGAAPDWRPLPPDPAETAPLRLAPSRAPDRGREAEGAEPPAVSPLAGTGAGAGRFLRGKLLHALLQHLPDLPRESWTEAAAGFLRGVLPPAEVAETVAAVLDVLRAPALAEAFAPGSRAEVPLAGVVAGQVVAGLVDRLAVGPDSVLIVDFKTNRRPPRDAAATPVAYLRQMAAYRAVLRHIYPGRAVRCVLVWTEGGRVDALSADVLDRHAPDAA